MAVSNESDYCRRPAVILSINAFRHPVRGDAISPVVERGKFLRFFNLLRAGSGWRD
jgi:hypothetical protein